MDGRRTGGEAVVCCKLPDGGGWRLGGGQRPGDGKRVPPQPCLLPWSPGRPACPSHPSGWDTRPLRARSRVNNLIHRDRPGVTACEVYPKSKVVFLRVWATFKISESSSRKDHLTGPLISHRSGERVLMQVFTHLTCLVVKVYFLCFSRLTTFYWPVFNSVFLCPPNCWV